MVGNICRQEVDQFVRSLVFLEDIVEAKDGNEN